MATPINLTSYPAVRTNYLVSWELPYYRTTPTGSTSSVILTFNDDDYTTVLDGINYVPLGKLLQITPSTSALGAVTNQVSLTLSGIPDSEVGAVLYSNIKGTIIRISRYFWDAQNTFTSLGPGQGRFNGYVESYSIEDDYRIFDKQQTVSITLNLNSWVDYLNTKRNSRQTNPNSMKTHHSTDTSFDRVARLKDTEFNFGKSRTQSAGPVRPQSTGGIWV